MLFGALVFTMSGVGLVIAALGNPVIYNVIFGGSVEDESHERDLF